MSTLLDLNISLNKLYNCDCIDGFSKMMERGIFADIIVADPPYVISRESNFHTMQDRKKPRTGTSFGEWDEEFDNHPWLTAAYSSLRPGGTLVVFNDFKKISDVIRLAGSVGFVFKDVLVWEKTNPMPRNRERRYIPSLEMMLWFVKPGEKWIFNRQDSPYERPVFRFASESGGGYKRIHPTQKPVKLIQEILKIHSTEGSLVVDPFMGSGTTAIAAMNEGQNFIGFELSQEYYEASVLRIELHGRR